MQQSVYDKILAILCSVLDAYSTVLFLPGDGTLVSQDMYAVNSSFSLGDKIDFSSTIAEGQGLVGWILRNKEPLLVANFDQRCNHLGYYKDYEEQNIKAFMGCALQSGRGALCVDSKRQYSFSEKDQKMLYLFAGLISSLQTEMQVEFQRANILKYYTALRTIYALRHQHSRWTEFLRHFIDLMVTVTDFSYCVFCTRDSYGDNYFIEGESSPLLLKNGGESVSFPMSHGMVGWIFRNGRPVVSDIKEGVMDTPLVGRGAEGLQFQTVAAFPLIVQRKTRGVLCLAHERSVLVETETKDFIQMASDHLALFLENLYVKCKLRDLHKSITVPE